MKATHVLVGKAIDYAGLFPPAGLDMRSAVDNYASYRAGEDPWALGRFILPSGRLPEFEAAAETYFRSEPNADPWRLAALAGPDLSADLAGIADFNQRYDSPRRRKALVDSIELKASSPQAITDTMHRVPDHLQAYVEIPIDRDPASLVEVMAGSRLRAKVRTGGVTQDAFPRSTDLIRFIMSCIRAKVPFKATAGLHHPICAEYRLTYAPDSPRAGMFGFLNLFIAAAFLSRGLGEEKGRLILEERSSGAFELDEAEVRWRGQRLGLADIRRAREEVIISFGSCSFTEPISELQELQLLGPKVPQT